MSRKMPCIVGTLFGALTVVDETEPSVYTCQDGTLARIRRWVLRCDCGKTVVRHASYVRTGYATSCGCKRRRYIGQHPTVPGQRFGRLVVLGDVPGRGARRWHCRCDCGAEKSVSVNEVTRGSVLSCGCYQRDVNSGRAKRGAYTAMEREPEIDPVEAVRRQFERLPLCPSCGTRQRRDEEIVYCPNRCDGVITVLSRRKTT
jgi:hypothetical protein